MKKILLMAIFALLVFSGCATDGVYNISKDVYIGGKKVVEKNKDLIGENTMETLGTVDRVAVGYDTIRSEVRHTNKKKYVDINSTKTE